MIKNACDQPLFANPGTLPNMQDVLAGWFQQIVFTRVIKSVVGFQNVEKQVPESFMGVKQPFTAQQLRMKPEGQRHWKWFTIHAWPDLILTTDDIINILGQNYRIKEKMDFKEYGYVEYHCVEDYIASPAR